MQSETDDLSEQMRRSMLEQTEADEWDELTAATRIELVKMKLDSSDDLSEEQVRWLIDEQKRAMADLKEALQDMVKAMEEHVKPYLEAVVEGMQPLAELMEDIETNGE